MLPLIVIVVGMGLMAVAYAGWRLVRSPVDWERFEAGDPRGARTQQSGRVSLVQGLATRLRPWAVSLAGERMLERYRHQLQAAGSPDGVTVEDFVARKAIYSVAFGVVGLVLFLSGSTLTGLALPVLGFFLQDIWLQRAVRKRQAAVERDLPDFLDVLSITVEAGLGFQSALRRVGSATEGPLGEEVDRALKQMSLGMPRREAFDLMRRRNDSDILSQFITALLQAEELGAPLAEALRGMADDLREQWYQKARRDAARAAPRISMIVSFTLVPASMTIIVVTILLSSGFSLDTLTGG